jgi:hypothetical protein
MSNLREVAYRLDPVSWVREVLGIEPANWQEEFLRAPWGASILALTARQCGKTTTAAWAMAHAALFVPGSLSVVACPAQRQSAEAVRRVREAIIKAGGKLETNNVYGLELTNGSRVLALPGSDDSIRGLTVDAWIVADEAARLPNDLIAALRPMRARRPEARFAMLSTSFWNKSGARWGNMSLNASTSASPAEDRQVPSRGNCMSRRRKSTCPWCRLARHLARPFRSAPCPSRTRFNVSTNGRIAMRFNPHDFKTWDCFKTLIIAHDVGRTRDRSTAVIGGLPAFDPNLIGIQEAHELPQGLYGSARASALAVIDRQYDSAGLIVADLSNDPTYAEVLYETFGRRVVGLQISRHGQWHGCRAAAGQKFGDVGLHRWPLLSARTLSFAVAVWSGENSRSTNDPTRL